MSYSKEVCLDLEPQSVNNCINPATLYANLNLIDTGISHAKRAGVKTRIVWATNDGADKEISFYVEQMLFN